MDYDKFERICDCLENDDPSGPEWSWEEIFDFLFQDCEDQDERIRNFLYCFFPSDEHSWLQLRVSTTLQVDTVWLGMSNPFHSTDEHNMDNLRFLQDFTTATHDEWRLLHMYIDCRTRVLPIT